MWIWVSTALMSLVMTLGLLVLLISLRKRAGSSARRTNYRVLFLMGVVMLTVGTAELLIFVRTDIPYAVAVPLVGIGLVFALIGAANRDKWQGR